MENIRLVGVNHHVARTMSGFRLMDDSCEADFAERVLPLIDDQSIVFAEGHFQGLVPPTHLEYARKLAVVSPTLAASGRRPTLGFVDPRMKGNQRQDQQMVDDVMTLIDFGTRFLQCMEKPMSSDEVIAIIKREPINCRLYMQIDQQLRSVANRTKRCNESFDKAHVAWMAKAASMHSGCFLIAGAAHCLSLHVKTGWDLVLLKSQLMADPAELLSGYLNVQWFPRMINKFAPP